MRIDTINDARANVRTARYATFDTRNAIADAINAFGERYVVRTAFAVRDAIDAIGDARDAINGACDAIDAPNGATNGATNETSLFDTTSATPIARARLARAERATCARIGCECLSANVQRSRERIDAKNVQRRVDMIDAYYARRDRPRDAIGVKLSNDSTMRRRFAVLRANGASLIDAETIALREHNARNERARRSDAEHTTYIRRAFADVRDALADADDAVGYADDVVFDVEVVKNATPYGDAAIERARDAIADVRYCISLVRDAITAT